MKKKSRPHDGGRVALCVLLDLSLVRRFGYLADMGPKYWDDGDTEDVRQTLLAASAAGRAKGIAQ